MSNAQRVMAAPTRPRRPPPRVPAAPTKKRPVASAQEQLPHRAEPDGREAAIERYLGLAHSLARRYARSGQPFDDLVQVASLGLVKAVDRFDPSRGVPFEAYAIPTILGELKRHHRDHGWALRVPRRLQEHSVLLKDVVPAIAQDLKRSPTIAEIAEHAHLSEEEVLEAMDAQDAYAPFSLDAPVGSEDEGTSLIERLSVVGGGFEAAEDWVDLGPLLDALPERERKILILRFFHDWTQSQIAHEFEISQMHVSRLLSRSLQALRTAVAGGVRP